MSKKLFVHLGSPKTATTTIQIWAWENRDLLKQNGICYPSLVSDEQWQSRKLRPSFPKAHHILSFHHLKGWAAFPKEETATAWADLQKICQDEEGDVLISTEAFSRSVGHKAEEVLSHLRMVSAGREIVAVLYLRDHPDFLKSTAFQTIREGDRIVSFVDFALHPPAYAAKALDYSGLVAAIDTSPFVDRLVLRPFRRERFAGGDILTDFQTILGIPDLETNRDVIANTHNDTHAMQLLLSQINATNFRNAQPLRRLCYRMSRRTNDDSGSFNWSPQVQRVLRERYAEDRDFLDTYFESKFFPEPPKRHPPKLGAEKRIATAVYRHLVGHKPPAKLGYVGILGELRALEDAGELTFSQK